MGEDRVSNYTAYGLGHESRTIVVLSPSVIGFIRRYLLSITPALIVFLFEVAWFLGVRYQLIDLNSPYLQQFKVGSSVVSFIGFIAPLFIITLLAWVLRSTESLLSLGLTLILPLIPSMYFAHQAGLIPVEDASSVLGLLAFILEGYPAYFKPSAYLASLLTLIKTEAYRRSIKYVVSDTGIEVKGGLLRRRSIYTPYNQVGRVVLEQSLLGRMFNYGTIILVSAAEWGSEYYARG
ncbi:MAG: hypothetical protein DRJ47_03540, partial [Thermoprotei archaeon]